jgi:hypothetical protein
LADQGRLGDAEETFKKIADPSLSVLDRIAVTATEGLLHFRRGRVVPGRERYLDAMSLAERESLDYMRILAVAYWAREEEIAHTTEADAAWDALPPIGHLRERYADVAAFVERIAFLREVRRRDSAVR